MSKTILKLILGSVLLTVTACAPGTVGTATLDPNSINTAIAQTVTALTLTSEPGIPVTGPESPTPTMTFSPSPEPPSPTPSATPSPMIIFTPTSAVPQISVSIPTNCRAGPGIPYDRVGALLVGEVAEVVGRHATRDYWIIRNPDRDGICWLWGRYATLSGNTDVLPIYTPPPSPTPRPTSTPTLTPSPTANFGALYDGLESCTGTGWWANIELSNATGVTFEAIAMTVRDTTNNNVLSLYSDTFTNRNGCNATDIQANLPSGSARIVSSPVFSYDPRGHALRATITLCSQPGLNGICATQVTHFTP